MDGTGKQAHRGSGDTLKAGLGWWETRGSIWGPPAQLEPGEPRDSTEGEGSPPANLEKLGMLLDSVGENQPHGNAGKVKPQRGSSSPRTSQFSV